MQARSTWHGKTFHSAWPNLKPYEVQKIPHDKNKFYLHTHRCPLWNLSVRNHKNYNSMTIIHSGPVGITLSLASNVDTEMCWLNRTRYSGQQSTITKAGVIGMQRSTGSWWSGQDVTVDFTKMIFSYLNKWLQHYSQWKYNNPCCIHSDRKRKTCVIIPCLVKYMVFLYRVLITNLVQWIKSVS